MNAEQFKGIVERLATIAITYAVARGWIPADQATPIVVAVVAVASVAWGWYVNTHKSLSTATQNVEPAK